MLKCSSRKLFDNLFHKKITISEFSKQGDP